MEEEIKELLGDSYQEGMSAKDIQEAFNKMLLNSGKYVNKDNADAQQRKLEKQLNDKIQALEDEKKALNDSLTNKMTDEEKVKAAQAKKDEEFEEMRKLLAQSRLDANTSSFMSNISEAKKLAQIEDEDDDFSNFISNAVIVDDKEKNNSISKYINAMVKKAYEKGKADATKEDLGKMGKDGKSSQGDEDGTSEAELKIKDIIAKSAKQNDSYYFKKNN